MATLNLTSKKKWNALSLSPPLHVFFPPDFPGVPAPEGGAQRPGKSGSSSRVARCPTHEFGPSCRKTRGLERHGGLMTKKLFFFSIATFVRAPFREKSEATTPRVATLPLRAYYSRMAARDLSSLPPPPHTHRRC